jgi:hypothetical protein
MLNAIALADFCAKRDGTSRLCFFSADQQRAFGGNVSHPALGASTQICRRYGTAALVFFDNAFRRAVLSPLGRSSSGVPMNEFCANSFAFAVLFA